MLLYYIIKSIIFSILENCVSNDSNSCTILDDDDDNRDNDKIISKPVNNTEQIEDSNDDDCVCVDLTDS